MHNDWPLGHTKSMCKPWGHPQLAVVTRIQMHPHPSSKSGRIRADIYRHIKNRSRHDTQQFPLGPHPLKMKPPQDIFSRARQVVLNKRPNPCRLPQLRIPMAHKTPPSIFKMLEIEDQNLRYLSGNDAHRASSTHKA